MSAKFALDDVDRNLYVEQIVAVGLAALETRARGGSKESEASTRREAESVVQASYITSTSVEDLKSKIYKMAKKLDPHTVITTYLQSHTLVRRLVQSKNPVFHRELAVMERVLGKGHEATALLSAFSDVKKVNSVVKAYNALQKEVLRDLTACTQKLDAALRMYAQPGSINNNNGRASAQHMSLVFSEVLPKVTEGLHKLALTPATHGCIAAPLQALSSQPVDGNTKAIGSALVSALVALTLSLSQASASASASPASVEGTSDAAAMLPRSNLQPVPLASAHDTNAGHGPPDYFVAAVR